MALTGELAFRGLTILNAHLRVMGCNHRTVDRSIEDDEGNVTWSKVLIADYSARIYKDAAAYAANPDQAVTTISGSFTPSRKDANIAPRQISNIGVSKKLWFEVF